MDFITHLVDETVSPRYTQSLQTRTQTEFHGAVQGLGLSEIVRN